MSLQICKTPVWFLAFGLVGCIAPNAALTPQTGEPSDEVLEDKWDTAEVDTGVEGADLETLGLDVNAEPESGYGLVGMKGWHLLFDGELALKREVQSSNDEYNQFLQPDTPWGFALNVAPYNDDVTSFLFGEGESGGKPFVLFQTDSVVLSMQFVPVTAPEVTGVSLAPQVRYIIRDKDTGQVCYETDWFRNTNDFVSTREILKEGFQMIMTYGQVIDGGSGGANLYFRDKASQQYPIFHYPDMEQVSGCPVSSNEVTEIVFGQGTEVVVDNQKEVLHHLRGRIDDLLLFRTQMGGFTFEQSLGEKGLLSEEMWLSEPDNYHGYDFLPNDESDDGFAWFGFHKVLSDQMPNEHIDDSVPLGGNGEILSMNMCRHNDNNALSCQVGTIGQEWIQDRFRNGNDTFESGMWLDDFEEPPSPFEENMNFMSASHLVMDGTMFLQHQPEDVSSTGTTRREGLTATVPFLDVSEGWGFAMKWAPDSQATSDLIFGGSNGTGTPMSLFRVGNNLLTIRFPRIVNHVHPELVWRTLSNESGSVSFCRRIDLYDDLNVPMDVSQLEAGMKLMAVYEVPTSGASNSTFKFQINGVPIFDGEINTEPLPNGSGSINIANCMGVNAVGDVVDFGDGLTVNGNSLSPLYGRVDDLMIFHVNDSFVAPFTEYMTSQDMGSVTATSVTTGALDNVLWWSMDQDMSTPQNLMEEFQYDNPNIESQPFKFTMMNGTSSSATELTRQQAIPYFDGN